MGNGPLAGAACPPPTALRRCPRQLKPRTVWPVLQKDAAPPLNPRSACSIGPACTLLHPAVLESATGAPARECGAAIKLTCSHLHCPTDKVCKPNALSSKSPFSLSPISTLDSQRTHLLQDRAQLSMLCQSCLTSIKAASESLNLALPEDTYHESSNILHNSLSNLHQSVVEGCWICRQLWESILAGEDYITENEGDFSKQDGNSAEHEDRSAMEFKILEKWRKSRNSSIQLTMVCWDKVLYLKLEPTQYRELDLILWPLSTNEVDLDASKRSNLASASTLPMQNPGLWSRWYRTCSESHRKCRGLDDISQPFAPDRLVEIFTNDEGNSFTWRLVRRAEIGNVQYLTLSHCWGSSGHTSLTKENYSTLIEPTTDSRLPKSFRHAFSITFSLGFRYIWIDSLCIIQDDREDWEAQASMMGSVYKNACCNIAAAWAANGNDGCFTTRESRIIKLNLGHGQLIDYHVIPDLLYYDDIMEAPLNRRGWVAQERFLATKQLSFARSQVYWECRELVASEQFPEGIRSRLCDFLPYNQAVPPADKPTLNYTLEEDRRQAWAALVDFYSSCNFSWISDKMMALAGLAEEMRYATKDVYLAGLWKKDLERQLCWKTDDDVRRRVNRSRTPTYLAPTWSWASVNGPVISDQRYYRAGLEYPSCIEILDASIQSEHFSKVHSFVASSLVLRGIAVWARAMRRGQLTSHLDEGDWELQWTGLDDIFHHGIMTGTDTSIIWDENMSSSAVNPDRWTSFLEERNSKLLWMFVYIEDSIVTGLLLRKLPGATDDVSYVRMGIFMNWDGSLLDLLSGGLKYPTGRSIVEDINLDDAGLANLVHTVTIL